MKTLYDYIVASAESATALQKSDGSFPAGVNGPHNQPETPVRVTAHWLICLLKAYEITNNKKYHGCAESALNYLLLPEHRPYQKTFVCRNLPGLDKANGLIGQAWVVEALCKAATCLDHEESANLAYELFALHPFDKKLGLWEIVDADGSRFRTRYDLVTNHQIWFAAAASDLLSLPMPENKHKRVQETVTTFLDLLHKNLKLNADSTFRHNVSARLPMLVKTPTSYLKTSKGYSNLKRMIKGNKRDLAAGYHAFHTYGLAILTQKQPQHPFWSKSFLGQGLYVLSTEAFAIRVADSKYGLHYNPPGIEAAFTIEIFRDYFDQQYDQQIGRWLAWQMEKTWDSKQNIMAAVQYDPVTYASRIYEATRIGNYTLF